MPAHVPHACCTSCSGASRTARSPPRGAAVFAVAQRRRGLRSGTMGRPLGPSHHHFSRATGGARPDLTATPRSHRPWTVTLDMLMVPTHMAPPAILLLITVTLCPFTMVTLCGDTMYGGSGLSGKKNYSRVLGCVFGQKSGWVLSKVKLSFVSSFVNLVYSFVRSTFGGRITILL